MLRPNSSAFSVTALANGFQNVSPQSPPNKGLLFRPCPLEALISTTFGFPWVKVPVLSMRRFLSLPSVQIDSSLDQDPLPGCISNGKRPQRWSSQNECARTGHNEDGNRSNDLPCDQERGEGNQDDRRDKIS